MTDDRQLRALIADMRSIESQYQPTPEAWTEAELARVFDPDDAEIRRFTAGATVDPEVARYLDIAAQEARNG